MCQKMLRWIWSLCLTQLNYNESIAELKSGKGIVKTMAELETMENE